jgi:hypothetical protein
VLVVTWCREWEVGVFSTSWAEADWARDRREGMGEMGSSSEVMDVVVELVADGAWEETRASGVVFSSWIDMVVVCICLFL